VTLGELVAALHGTEARREFGAVVQKEVLKALVKLQG
jgi:hypothetical protein